MRLSHNTTIDGKVTVADGAMLECAVFGINGSHRLETGASLAGTGQHRILGGSGTTPQIAGAPAKTIRDRALINEGMVQGLATGTSPAKVPPSGEIRVS